MQADLINQLQLNGPDRVEDLTVAEARRRSMGLATSRYENFSVVTRLVPRRLRDDFAAVYAFCRWADDLGDEAGDAQRSQGLLSWWREELQGCFAGSPRHPVFVALRPTIERHDLPIEPFDQLIQAFELDQTKTRYATWSELTDYCRLSANPVGRLVLMLCGPDRSSEQFRLSDCICTALQLTNHFQDVQRDLLDRDRIYLPAELHSIEGFEDRLRVSANQGFSADQTFLGEYRILLRQCVRRTWDLYGKGEGLVDLLEPSMRPVIWLFMAGGMRTLRLIEMWNYETALRRPRLSGATKMSLVVSAWVRFRRAGGGG